MSRHGSTFGRFRVLEGDCGSFLFLTSRPAGPTFSFCSESARHLARSVIPSRRRGTCFPLPRCPCPRHPGGCRDPASSFACARETWISLRKAAFVRGCVRIPVRNDRGDRPSKSVQLGREWLLPTRSGRSAQLLGYLRWSARLCGADCGRCSAGVRARALVVSYQSSENLG